MKIKILSKKYNQSENCIEIEYSLLTKQNQIVYTGIMKDNLSDDTKDTIDQFFRLEKKEYGEWKEHNV